MTPGAMAALHAHCFTTPRPWTAEEFETLLADPLCFAIIESDGFVIGRAVAGEAEILTLAVASAARRQGLGLRLVQAFLSRAGKLRAGVAFLEVAADNLAAIALYQAAGFAQTGRRRGYYAQPKAAAIDALVMGRAI